MCQPRGAIAGGMVLDLDNSSVMAVECEDRHYCFQITSPNGKTCVFQPVERLCADSSEELACMKVKDVSCDQ